MRFYVWLEPLLGKRPRLVVRFRQVRPHRNGVLQKAVTRVEELAAGIHLLPVVPLDHLTHDGVLSRQIEPANLVAELAQVRAEMGELAVPGPLLLAADQVDQNIALVACCH